MTNTKPSELISRLEGVDFRLESVDLWLQSLILGSKVHFGCLFSALEIFRCLLLIERECLNLGVDLQSRGHVLCSCSTLWIFRCLSFPSRREILICNTFLSEGESLILGAENLFLLRVKTFGLESNIFHLNCTLQFFTFKSLFKWEGKGPIYREIPPFTLGSNGLALLLGFKLGTNLSQLNLRVDVHLSVGVDLRIDLWVWTWELSST